MSDAATDLAFLRDSRLAAHATSTIPAWLWSTNGTRILWANAVAAAIFGAPTPAALADRSFADDPAGQQIARLAATLFPGGAQRLERLRGFGGGLGRPLVCTCSRLAFDHTAGVLVVATQSAGPALSLAERARRLMADEEAAAAFTPDGTLVTATTAGRERLGGTSLAALGAGALVTAALARGQAYGDTPRGAAEIDRLGSGAASVLMVRFTRSEPEPKPEAIPIAEPAPLHEAGPAPEAGPIAAPVPVYPPPAEPEPEPRSEPEPAAPPVMSEPTPAISDAAPVTSDAAPATSEPAPPAETSAPAQPPLLRIDVPLPERRYPLRFVWQMDAWGRFTLGSDEFTEVIGPTIAVALGRPWKEIAAEFALDPDNQVLAAVTTRDTWSGISVAWPVEGSAERLSVELSGLPVYDRERTFLGYRGFGVCRDLGRLAALARLRRPAVFTPAQGAHAGSAEPEDHAAGGAAARNVVPFPGASADGKPTHGLVAETKPPTLSPGEHNAFRELARQLSARLNGDDEVEQPAPVVHEEPVAAEPALTPEPQAHENTVLLDRLPVGMLVYRFEDLLYANPAFLTAIGYPTLDALVEAGGLESLFIEGDAEGLSHLDAAGRPLAILTHGGDKMPVGARLFSLPWAGEPAMVLMLMRTANDERQSAAETALRLAETQIRELRSILDAATDGIVVVEPDGRIASASLSAEVLFGYETGTLAGRAFADLFTAESRGAAADRLARPSGAEAGLEVTGRMPQGGAIPLFMTLGPVAESPRRTCAVFRDLTAWKKAEADLFATIHQAGPTDKSEAEVLAKLSHEMRTPLNSILGFAEMMLEERYGPIGNERYRDYLKDIRESGAHVIAVLNDLLDLSKVEAGKLELSFADVDLNEIVQGCVRVMQPQANRERIIIRTALSPHARPILADAQSLHQIILNLLGNAIKFAGAGGQVIVSTGQTSAGEMALRVRDTGVGMSGKDLEAALQPFRQVTPTTQWGTAGSGLGLPLTKALAEANRGTFTITSKVNDGTLVEIVFPSRVAAE